MRIAGAVLGVLIVGAVWVNVAITLVIPRGRVGFIRVVDRHVDQVYTAASRFVRTWERRDALLASQPVVTLGLLLFIWLAGFVVGYGLLLWLPGGSFPDALREAGSSLFTLGFAARSGTEPSVADFLAAASGLIIVALQIAYLPTLYAAYNRRETEVTLLGPAGRQPGMGAGAAGKGADGRGIDQLTVIYEAWERWSADVAESHSSYPSLLRFRSPEPHSSWVVSQLAVLDAAALHMAACPETAPFTARLCVQMGFTCLRKLTRTLRIPVEEDPRPDDPIRLSWEEFLQGWERITSVGFPVERTAEEAWPHFRGWRVNYEAAACKLAVGPRRRPRPLVGSPPPRMGAVRAPQAHQPHARAPRWPARRLTGLAQPGSARRRWAVWTAATGCLDSGRHGSEASCSRNDDVLVIDTRRRGCCVTAFGVPGLITSRFELAAGLLPASLGVAPTWRRRSSAFRGAAPCHVPT